jgi:hypothetical protein
MARRKIVQAPGDAPGLAVHAAAVRVEALLKERERLLREVAKRKRLIEQARAKADRDEHEAATKLGPLFARHHALVRELTALFDALLGEPHPPRARNTIGKLRASLVSKGVLAPLSDSDSIPDSDPTPDSDPIPDSSPNPNPRAHPSAQQPPPERRSLRDIFRSLARSLHPDQAREEAERLRRTELMKDLTRAYERGDLARLLELENEWQASRAPAAGEGDSLARCQELERTNRELLKQVRQLTRELKGTKDDARAGAGVAPFGSIDRTAARAARELDRLEALCELVREFKRGSRTLAELSLGESLV